MTTDYKMVARIMASVIWADETYDEAERVAVAEIADALEYDVPAFVAAVDAEFEAVKDKDGDALGEYLQTAADAVAEEEVAIVLQAAIQLIVSDGSMGVEEIELLHTVAEVLGLTPAMATMFVADMVKHEPELEIEL